MFTLESWHTLLFQCRLKKLGERDRDFSTKKEGMEKERQWRKTDNGESDESLVNFSFSLHSRQTTAWDEWMSQENEKVKGKKWIRKNNWRTRREIRKESKKRKNEEQPPTDSLPSIVYPLCSSLLFVCLSLRSSEWRHGLLSRCLSKLLSQTEREWHRWLKN